MRSITKSVPRCRATDSSAARDFGFGHDNAKLYTIFEGTSEIQRIVISSALGAADGGPPMHVDLEPSGGGWS